MQKVPACFELIKAMSKPEKIHFKKYLSYKTRKGEPTIYVKLFDELDAQKIYSDKRIKTKFASQNFIKHLATSYNYLYNILLKSLRDYNSDKKDDIVARDMLYEIRILIEKRLLKQARHQLKRAKKYIEERELYHLLYELGGLEHELCVIEMTDDQFNYVLQVNRSRRLNLQKLVDELDISKASNTLFDIIHNPNYEGDRNADARISLEELLSFKGIIDDSSTRAKTFYYHGLMTYYSLNKEPHKEIVVSKKLLDIWVNLPRNLKYSPVTFSIVLFNHFSAAKVQYDAEEILLYIPVLEKIVKLQTNLKHKCQVIENHFLTTAYLIKGQFEKVDKSIETYLQKFDLLFKKNVPFYKVIILNDFIQYYFLKNNFDECLTWTNRLLSLKLPESLNINLTNARLIEIICHYELENYYLIDSLAKSAKRFINKNENLEESDFIKLEFLKHFAKVITLSNSEQKSYWKNNTLDVNLYKNVSLDSSIILLFSWYKYHINKTNTYAEWQGLVKEFKEWFKAKYTEQIPIVINE